MFITTAADKLVVLPHEDEKVTSGGIIVPENVGKRQFKGSLFTLGRAITDFDDAADVDVFYGDDFVEVVVEDEKYHVMMEDNVLLYIEHDDEDPADDD